MQQFQDEGRKKGSEKEKRGFFRMPRFANQPTNG